MELHNTSNSIDQVQMNTVIRFRTVVFDSHFFAGQDCDIAEIYVLEQNSFIVGDWQVCLWLSAVTYSTLDKFLMAGQQE